MAHAKDLVFVVVICVGAYINSSNDGSSPYNCSSSSSSSSSYRCCCMRIVFGCRQHSCFQCLLIIRRHPNVIQYKESQCRILVINLLLPSLHESSKLVEISYFSVALFWSHSAQVVNLRLYINRRFAVI